jgi:hypothetical protein
MADEVDAKSNGLVLQSNGLVLQSNRLVLQSNGLVLQSNGDGQGFDSYDASAADSKSHSLHGQLFESYDAAAAGSKSHSLHGQLFDSYDATAAGSKSQSLLLDESEDGEISDKHPDAAAPENALPRYEYSWNIWLHIICYLQCCGTGTIFNGSGSDL